jgi:hypothetical protein
MTGRVGTFDDGAGVIVGNRESLTLEVKVSREGNRESFDMDLRLKSLRASMSKGLLGRGMLGAGGADEGCLTGGGADAGTMGG